MRPLIGFLPRVFVMAVFAMAGRGVGRVIRAAVVEVIRGSAAEGEDREGCEGKFPVHVVNLQWD